MHLKNYTTGFANLSISSWHRQAGTVLCPAGLLRGKYEGDTFFKDLLRYLLARKGVYAPFGPALLANAMQRVGHIVCLTAYG